MQLIRLLLIISISALISCSIFAGDKTVIRVGRYLAEKNGPEVSQADPFKQVFSITFPPTAYTVKDAMTYLLTNAGYNLAPNINQSISARNLLQQRLPLSDKQMGPMTIEQGLLTLSGNAYQLLIDPEKRLVSFQIKKNFEKLYTN